MKARITGILFLLVFAAVATVSAADKAEAKWVATWAASPQAASFGFPAPRSSEAPKPKMAPPAKPAAPSSAKVPAFFAVPEPLNNQTVRQVVRASIGGKSLRVKISNAHGSAPLVIGAASVALQDQGSAIVAGSLRALTFNGKPGFVIPPGALAVSDVVDMPVPALASLAISLYVPGESGAPTVHLTGLHTTYISQPGDFTQAATIDNPASTLEAWYWIAGVDVLAASDAWTIVAFGDSITDGATSTPNKDASWPSQLAGLLQSKFLSNKKTDHIGVVNHGISGNRVLADGAGISALARFDRDVLATPGAKWLVILEGINDIGMSTMGGMMGGGAPLTADDLIAAYKQMIDRAHMHGIEVIGATLLPYGGASYYSEKGEAIRQAVNKWIRDSGAFDKVVDFDKALRDPKKPNEMDAKYYINDHLHPNDEGYGVMANRVHDIFAK